MVNWRCGAFWLVQLKDNKLIKYRLVTLKKKKEKKYKVLQNAWILSIESCDSDVSHALWIQFSEKHKYLGNVETFWEKKIIGKFWADMC